MLWDAQGRSRQQGLTGSGPGGWWSGSGRSPFGRTAVAGPGSAPGWSGPPRPRGRAAACLSQGMSQAGAGFPLGNTRVIHLVHIMTAIKPTQFFSTHLRGRTTKCKNTDSRTKLLGLNEKANDLSLSINSCVLQFPYQWNGEGDLPNRAVLRIKRVAIGCAYYSRDWHEYISYHYSCQRLLGICIWKCEEMKGNQLNCGVSLDHQHSYNGQSNHWVLSGESDCPPKTFITKACPLPDYKLFLGEWHWIYPLTWVQVCELFEGRQGYSWSVRLSYETEQSLHIFFLY